MSGSDKSGARYDETGGDIRAKCEFMTIAFDGGRALSRRAGRTSNTG
jgi:hypothetical protein